MHDLHIMFSKEILQKITAKRVCLCVFVTQLQCIILVTVRGTILIISVTSTNGTPPRHMSTQNHTNKHLSAINHRLHNVTHPMSTQTLPMNSCNQSTVKFRRFTIKHDKLLQSRDVREWRFTFPSLPIYHNR